MQITIFDRDGVIHRTPQAVMKRVLNLFGKEYYIEKDYIIPNGYVMPDHLLHTERGLEIQKKFLEEYMAEKVSNQGIKRILSLKEKGATEILTYNASIDLLMKMLEQPGVEGLFGKITYCDINYPNQTKANYLRIVREENDSNTKIVFITDTVSDLREGHKSGINPIMYFVTEDWNIPKEVYEYVKPEHIIKPFYV